MQRLIAITLFLSGCAPAAPYKTQTLISDDEKHEVYFRILEEGISAHSSNLVNDKETELFNIGECEAVSVHWDDHGELVISGKSAYFISLNFFEARRHNIKLKLCIGDKKCEESTNVYKIMHCA